MSTFPKSLCTYIADYLIHRMTKTVTVTTVLATVTNSFGDGGKGILFPVNSASSLGPRSFTVLLVMMSVYIVLLG